MSLFAPSCTQNKNGPHMSIHYEKNDSLKSVMKIIMFKPKTSWWPTFHMLPYLRTVHTTGCYRHASSGSINGLTGGLTDEGGHGNDCEGGNGRWTSLIRVARFSPPSMRPSSAIPRGPLSLSMAQTLPMTQTLLPDPLARTTQTLVPDPLA